MKHVARYFPYLLVFLHAINLAWGFLGLLEYFIPAVSLGLQNANFPAGIQFLHFLAIMATGTIFVGGYFTRWHHTSFVTVVMYAVLATICFIETVDFGAWGGGPDRFLIMFMEYVIYVVFAAYMLRSSTMRRRFSLD
jgi:hypothetical protein